MEWTKRESFVLAVFLSALFIASGFIIRAGFAEKQERKRTAYEEGRAAARSGVTAEANPYKGHVLEYSRDWLRGWVEYQDGITNTTRGED